MTPLPIIDIVPEKVELVRERSDLGLTPPQSPADPLEGVFYRFLGSPAYVKEGRETFNALVPDRYKTRAG